MPLVYATATPSDQRNVVSFVLYKIIKFKLYVVAMEKLTPEPPMHAYSNSSTLRSRGQYVLAAFDYWHPLPPSHLYPVKLRQPPISVVSKPMLQILLPA